MQILSILNIVLICLVVLVLTLVIVYVMMVLRGKTNKKAKEEQTDTSKTQPTTADYSKDSIYNFLDFDDITDNMIVRKNGSQYVMIIQCQGVNYDLMSEEEQMAVEEGFVQFLNTLRFPIQLYVQTRSLNLRDIIEEYKKRVNQIASEINQFGIKIEQARNKGDRQLVERLEFEKRKKENVLDYGIDISTYVDRMSLNRNVLQQKTYIIIPYFSAEIGSIANYSKEEISNLCFSELYTRCQSILRSLASCSVSGKVLTSEDLAELLFVAYNRDDSEKLQLSKVLDSGYDNLYTTAKDVLIKKQEIIEESIADEAVDLVTNSIYEADNHLKSKEEEKKGRKRKVKSKALEILKEYEDQMTDQLYEETRKQIEETIEQKEKQEEKSM